MDARGGGEAREQDGSRGRAAHIDPIKPNLKPPGTKRLKLNRDVLLTTSAFKFNSRRYVVELQEETEKKLAGLEFVEGNAEHLPFEDGSVDVYTIAFGLRNVTDTLAALKDAHRLLRPGGRFMCLEFSHVEFEPLKSFYDFYSFNVIPAMGQAVAKDKESYQYLVESIRKFPKQEELKDLMREAGFKSVAHEDLTGGVVAIHSGFKL